MNDSKNISENYEKDNSLSAKLYKEINEFSQVFICFLNSNIKK